MKEFYKLISRYVAPYKRYLFGSLFFNILSAVLNVFSFVSLIPMLQLLFGLDTTVYKFIPWDTAGMGMKDIFVNNLYYYTTELIAVYGASTTLLLIGSFLVVATFLKTGCYFASVAIMVPMRTGIVRDIRSEVYHKIISLPLSFFSGERKGDIIARMSGDVTEIEVSIVSSLDMLIKNPILIICYFAALIYLSWELTLFTVTVVPVMAWGMSAIGKKLKRRSLEAQDKWSETMAQLDETLGGLRIIKAFIAEDKMKSRFTQTADDYRRASAKVAVRQASAHPVSEFLGSVMIMIVLWFGGTLILSEKAPIDASTFIYYMTILYSVLTPLKEFSRASYNIPRGLGSMERVDKIMNAVNNIKDPVKPEPLKDFEDCIEFKGVSFRYEDDKEVLRDIDVKIPKGKMVAFVGQSGSGKSTLVRNILYRSLMRHFGNVCEAPGQCEAVEGALKQLAQVEFIDQNPIGKSSRSNPVTYLKVYDDIRHLFAQQPLAKQLGFGAGHFSFNADGGRCEECKGEGTITVSMQFMADLKLECEACHGKRFKSEVLEVKFHGKNIHDILEMTIGDAINFFQEHGQKRIADSLQPLQDVGLASLLHQMAPEMRLHASTQMSVHTLAGVQLLAEMGFRRVVLSRELSLEFSIARIRLS